MEAAAVARALREAGARLSVVIDALGGDAQAAAAEQVAEALASCALVAGPAADAASLLPLLPAAMKRERAESESARACALLVLCKFASLLARGTPAVVSPVQFAALTMSLLEDVGSTAQCQLVAASLVRTLAVLVSASGCQQLVSAVAAPCIAALQRKAAASEEHELSFRHACQLAQELVQVDAQEALRPQLLAFGDDAAAALAPRFGDFVGAEDDGRAGTAKSLARCLLAQPGLADGQRLPRLRVLACALLASTATAEAAGRPPRACLSDVLSTLCALGPALRPPALEGTPDTCAQLWDVIEHGLRDTAYATKKCALHLLRGAAPAAERTAWDAYIAAYDTLDEYNQSFVCPVWPRLEALLLQGAVPYRWIRVLLMKALRHDSYPVRRFAVTSLLRADSRVIALLPRAFLLGPLLAAATSLTSLYRGRAGAHIVADLARFIGTALGAVHNLADRRSLAAELLSALARRRSVRADTATTSAEGDDGEDASLYDVALYCVLRYFAEHGEEGLLDAASCAALAELLRRHVAPAHPGIRAKLATLTLHALCRSAASTPASAADLFGAARLWHLPPRLREACASWVAARGPALGPLVRDWLATGDTSGTQLNSRGLGLALALAGSGAGAEALAALCECCARLYSNPYVTEGMPARACVLLSATLHLCGEEGMATVWTILEPCAAEVCAFVELKAGDFTFGVCPELRLYSDCLADVCRVSATTAAPKARARVASFSARLAARAVPPLRGVGDYCNAMAALRAVLVRAGDACGGAYLLRHDPVLASKLLALAMSSPPRLTKADEATLYASLPPGATSCTDAVTSALRARWRSLQVLYASIPLDPLPAFFTAENLSDLLQRAVSTELFAFLRFVRGVLPSAFAAAPSGTEEFLDSCWNVVHQACDAQLTDAFFDVCFCEPVLRRPGATVKWISRLVEHGEKVPGALNHAVELLLGLWTGSGNDEIAACLTVLLLYGPIRVRGASVEEHLLWRCDLDAEVRAGEEERVRDSAMRARACAFACRSGIAACAAAALATEAASPGFFQDRAMIFSLTDRRRHRLWQALCCVLPTALEAAPALRPQMAHLALEAIRRPSQLGERILACAVAARVALAELADQEKKEQDEEKGLFATLLVLLADGSARAFVVQSCISVVAHVLLNLGEDCGGVRGRWAARAAAAIMPHAAGALPVRTVAHCALGAIAACCVAALSPQAATLLAGVAGFSNAKEDAERLQLAVLPFLTLGEFMNCDGECILHDAPLLFEFPLTEVAPLGLVHELFSSAGITPAGTRPRFESLAPHLLGKFAEFAGRHNAGLKASSLVPLSLLENSH
eukprot:TRINITY_DN4465_c0_g1_i3.p1 TRINITY_DN4465_c0_g1~~TRINITY_DN4465_c0_g1_i3.p1  ORF type:complete len:1332 (-),score=296.68 TRINITY_DN4465_c0_g1_i3:739-4704(-)